MKYNLVSGTDFSVSAICMGTMTFGSPVCEKDAIELIHYGLEKGINFIDTANMYEGYNRFAGSHGGVAEEIIGKSIAKNRSKYIVATKLGMKVGDAPEDEFTSPAAIQKHLDRSLKLLGTDYIDVYYLHKYDPHTPPLEILNALELQKKAGKLRFYAVSNYSATELSKLIDTAKKNSIPLPALCQPQLSLLADSSAKDILPLCAENGIGVVPYKILHGGVLTGKYKRGGEIPKNSRYAEKPDWVGCFDDALFDCLEEYERKASAAGLSMTQYAIQRVLEQQGVVSAIVGVKSKEQIDEACAVF